VTGRFEPGDAGASIKASGGALATHWPERHHEPALQGAPLEQARGVGRSPHPASRTAKIEKRSETRKSVGLKYTDTPP
jgi:hypothetical protein